MRTLLLLILAAGSAKSIVNLPEIINASAALTRWASVCEVDGQLLWNHSLCGPMVLVDPGTHLAVANEPDPQGEFKQHGTAFVGVAPDSLVSSNTAISWEGQRWTLVELPLPIDPFLRITLLAHESFHRIQPELGLSASDAPDSYLDTENGRIWLRLELRALARALRSSGTEARNSAADAMLFRNYRDQLCPGTASMEAAMEKQEGLPQYTGVLIALHETGEDISREARAVEDAEDSNAFARSFGYAVGPALGLLLDRYARGWRERAASAPSLDSMLISALNLRTAPGSIKSLALRRAANYGYRAVVAAEQEREGRHQALLKTIATQFLNGPTLQFPPASEMRRMFNPNILIPFPPYGVLYPNGTFIAAWGKLRVDSGGALVAPDNKSLRVQAPVDPAARPLRGTDWTLDLAPGWTIQPSGEAGSYVATRATEK